MINNYKNHYTMNVEYILTVFNRHGETYLCGGACRDILLKSLIKDWDFATILRPEDIKRVCDKNNIKHIDNAERYGTIVLNINGENFEITTFRGESEYIDERRPNIISFSNSLYKDSLRRDFTINSIYMDINGRVIDYHSGVEDLKSGIIKCVGNPQERITEDKLRCLRAIRFASRFNFKFDYDTEKALIGCDLSNISKERIREEFNKIIMCNNPSKWIRELDLYGLEEYIIPELSNIRYCGQNNHWHLKDSVLDHTLRVLDKCEPNLYLRLSALFHDLGKAITKTTDESGVDHFYSHHKESSRIAREIMSRLKYSNKEINYVCDLVYFHMIKYDKINEKSARRLISKVGEDKLGDLFKLMIADRLGAIAKYNDLENVFRLKFLCEKVLNEKQPFGIKDLNINGNDLIKEGFKQGKDIGAILKYLLEQVIDNPVLNNKEDLICMAYEVDFK